MNKSTYSLRFGIAMALFSSPLGEIRTRKGDSRLDYPLDRRTLFSLFSSLLSTATPSRARLCCPESQWHSTKSCFLFFFSEKKKKNNLHLQKREKSASAGPGRPTDQSAHPTSHSNIKNSGTPSLPSPPLLGVGGAISDPPRS